MCGKNFQRFRKVKKIYTEDDVQSGLRVVGIKPRIYNLGTWLMMIDDEPFDCGDQLMEHLDDDSILEHTYKIRFVQEMAADETEQAALGTPTIFGKFFSVTYYEPIDGIPARQKFDE